MTVGGPQCTLGDYYLNKRLGCLLVQDTKGCYFCGPLTPKCLLSDEEHDVLHCVQMQVEDGTFG